jgi:hypothetical protein
MVDAEVNTTVRMTATSRRAPDL